MRMHWPPYKEADSLHNLVGKLTHKYVESKQTQRVYSCAQRRVVVAYWFANTAEFAYLVMWNTMRHI